MTSTNATATYTIQLRDGVSSVASGASSALESLRNKINADQKALGEMQRAMARLKAGGLGKSDDFLKLRDQSTALRASIAGTQAEYLRLGGTFNATGQKATSFLAGLSQAGGPLGALATRMTSFLGSVVSLPGLLALGAAGLAAIATAFVAVWSAVIRAGAALTEFAIASANARRSEQLHLAGLTTLRFGYVAAAESGASLAAVIDSVSASSALSRSEVTRYTEQLYRMGLRGENLREAVEGATIAASVQGERYGQRFAGMAASAARSGRSVRALADDIRTRLGGIATRQALALDIQIARLREDMTGLFSEVRIDSFLSEIREVLSVFSATSISGRALRTLFGALFSGLSDSTRGTGSVVRAFFEGLIIGALRISIAVLNIRDGFRRAFGPVSGLLRPIVGDLDAIRIATGLGTLVIGALAGSLFMAAVAVGSVLAPLVLVGLAVTALASRVQALLSVDWRSIGQGMIDGLVSGLLAGRDRVLGAIRSLAADATSALSTALEIQSPSRVFASLGAQIPAGLAQGVERATPLAASALSASGNALKTQPVTGARTTAQTTNHIGPFYISVSGENAEDQASDLQNQLAGIFEGFSLTRGAT